MTASMSTRPSRNNDGRREVSDRSAIRHGIEGTRHVGELRLYVDVGEDAGELGKKLLAEGIIIRPLANWGARTAIRVSIGLPEENEAFVSALKRVVRRAGEVIPRLVVVPYHRQPGCSVQSGVAPQ